MGKSSHSIGNGPNGSCIAHATEHASVQILFKCPTPAIVFGNATKPSRFAHFWQGAQSLAPATRKDIEHPKVFQTHKFFTLLTSRRASCHNGVHFFDIHGVFCTCWLVHVLRATTACTFSTSQLPNVLRHCGVLHILIWKCASRHNGVHFFDISTSKSGPSMVCFVRFGLEMRFAPQRRALSRHLNLPAALASVLFDPPEPQICGKTHCFVAVVPFRAPASSVFWLFSLLWLFPPLLSYLSILSEVWLLNFLQ